MSQSIPTAVCVEAQCESGYIVPLPVPESAWDAIELFCSTHWVPIYALATKPRTVIVPGSLRQGQAWTTAALSPHTGPRYGDDTRVFAFPNAWTREFSEGLQAPMDTSNTPFPTRYAATTLALYHLAHGNTAMASDHLGRLLDFDVGYIGQTIQPWVRHRSRICRHHVRRLFERTVATDMPQHEAWLVLLAFERPRAMSFAGSGLPDDYAGATLDPLAPMADMSIRQWINLTEATLISVFRPRWNRTFQRAIPQSTHTSYRWFWDRGVQSMNLALIEPMPIRLGSETRPHRRSHLLSADFRPGLAALPSWSEREVMTDDEVRWQRWSMGHGVPHGAPPAWLRDIAQKDWS